MMKKEHFSTLLVLTGVTVRTDFDESENDGRMNFPALVLYDLGGISRGISWTAILSFSSEK